MLMFSRPRRRSVCRSGCCAACLIGFGVASMFGMPAQSIAIVMTFWVFVFWLWSEARPPVDPAPAAILRNRMA